MKFYETKQRRSILPPARAPSFLFPELPQKTTAEGGGNPKDECLLIPEGLHTGTLTK